MDRRNHPSRLSRPRPGYSGAATLGISFVVVAILVGCARPNVPTPPIPYQITFVDYTDTRTADARLNDQASPSPLRQHDVMQTLSQKISQSVFAGQQAQTHVQLLDYTTTQDRQNYAISMRVRFLTRVPSTRPQDGWLLPVEASCTSITHDNDVYGRKKDFTQEAIKQRSLYPVSEEGREETIWNDLFSRCSATLADQYAKALRGPQPNS